MESHPNAVGSLIENAGDYLETRLNLLKLKAINKSSDVSSSVVSRLTILLIIVLGLFLLNFGLAFWLGELLGKPYLGFFIVAGFYTLVAVLLHIFRNSWIKMPINGLIIRKMLN